MKKRLRRALTRRSYRSDVEHVGIVLVGQGGLEATAQGVGWAMTKVRPACLSGSVSARNLTP
jgi:hypothetical protein